MAVFETIKDAAVGRSFKKLFDAIVVAFAVGRDIDEAGYPLREPGNRRRRRFLRR